MSKRVLVFSIVSIILIAMLSSCKPEATPTTGASSSPQSSQAAAINLNGRKISIVAAFDDSPIPGTEYGDLMLKRLNDTEKKYNFKFQFDVLPADQVIPQFTASAMAGDALGDLIKVRHYWAFPALVDKKYILPLDDIFDMTKSNVNADIKRISTIGGKIYGFSPEKNGVGVITFFNKDMFAKNNFPDLYQLYSSGNWTWDKFEEIAKLATKDTNGDGKTDVWGSGHLEIFQQIEPIIFSFGGSLIEYKDDKPVSTLTGHGTLACLSFLNKLVMIDKTTEIAPAGAAWDYSIQQFQSGKYAMLIMGQFAAVGLKTNMTDKFGMVPMPKGGTATNYTNFLPVLHCMVMPSALNIDDAKIIARIYQEYTAPLEISDKAIRTSIEAYTCDTESVDMQLNLIKSAEISNHNIYNTPLWTVVAPAMVAAVKGTKTPSAAMNSVEQAWQTAINQTS